MRHAGRYASKKAAEGYADVLRKEGSTVLVERASVYDVYVVEEE